MSSRIADRLAQLQQEQQQTQAALAHLEQQRQGLLQQLIGQTYALEVLQGLLAAEPDPVEVPVFIPDSLYGEGAQGVRYTPVAP